MYVCMYFNVNICLAKENLLRLLLLTFLSEESPLSPEAPLEFNPITCLSVGLPHVMCPRCFHNPLKKGEVVGRDGHELVY